MNVVIAGHFTFPTGGAPTARIRNLALGLQECGADVLVLPMAPAKPPNQQGWRTVEPELITYEQMAPFSSTAGQGQRPAVVTQLRWFAGLYGAALPTYRRLARQIAQNRCDLFIGYGRNAALLAPLVRLCRERQVVTVLDTTEIPEQFAGRGGAFNPLYWDMRLGAQWLPKHFDVLSVITFGLQERYTQLGCQRILVIPSIEGWTDLPPVPPPAADGGFHLVYVGALIDRDAPGLLLAALRILQERGVQVTLEIVGRYAANAQGQRVAREIGTDPVLRTCTNLVGALGDAELADRLQRADGLILMRRNAPTEVNAFPTRLVEYLKQGRPVFVSDVGDIRRYLRHQVDAMLLSATDAAAVADAIQQVAAAPDRGYALGLQGRARGMAMFDRRDHVRRLLDYVSQQAPAQ